MSIKTQGWAFFGFESLIFAISFRISRVLMGYIEVKISLDSRLQTFFTYAIRILSILEVMAKIRFQNHKMPKPIKTRRNFDPVKSSQTIQTRVWYSPSYNRHFGPLPVNVWDNQKEWDAIDWHYLVDDCMQIGGDSISRYWRLCLHLWQCIQIR